MKFYERSEFRKLQATWYRKAAESGFRDIESPDGEWAQPDSEASYGLLQDDVELGHATWERASAALSDEMVWVGLYPYHRRFWALLLMGFTPERAYRLVNRDRRPGGPRIRLTGGQARAKAHAWHREILRRIER